MQQLRVFLLGAGGAQIVEVLVPHYGLNDAPRLWIEGVVRWLFSIGFVESKFDQCMLFFRWSDGSAVTRSDVTR